ncbi:MAG: hypothetical protein JSU74_11680 [Candidatus Zixiibacteriota bacterium]|nr:MAG: hypothetical protein JSU74_11680 [candidate division Zixibacteria bacterium]
MRSSSCLLAPVVILCLLAGPVTLAADGAIVPSLINEYEQQLDSQPNNRAIINAVTANDIKNISVNRDILVGHNKFFNHELKGTDVIDQKSSGRCWIFAGVNVLAPKVKNKLDLDDFELSEAYFAFYDKLEKANFFLERIIKLRDRPIDDRSLQIDIEYFFGDGGWFHFFTDIIKKYGLVPLSAMPETKQSTSTGNFNRLTKSILRSHAVRLRQMHQDGKTEDELREEKEKMLADVYKLLVYNYGKPPKEFVFRYEHEVDSVSRFIEKKYTPKSFYEEFYGDDLPEYVCLVNNPAIEYDQPYLLEASRNVWENPDFLVLNLSIEKLKEYTLKSLLDSQAVWFSCDVGQQNLKDSGIMADGIYDFGSTLNTDFALSKADRIRFKEVTPNHAMAIRGVDTASTGEPTKWLVENSWGTKYGDEGIWYMYDCWFSEYVLTVVVDKSLLSDEDRRKFEKKPTVIADWEPFFLALRNLD